jgi:hypothetical protein
VAVPKDLHAFKEQALLLPLEKIVVTEEMVILAIGLPLAGRPGCRGDAEHQGQGAALP